MTGFRAAIGRLLTGTRANRSLDLPPGIREEIARENLPFLEQWLQLLRSNPDGIDLDALIEEARQLNWQTKNIERLRIYGFYYRGALDEAHRLAVKYLAEEEFDAAIFSLACFSLYHMGRFEDAYTQLKSADNMRDLLESRPDYSVIAALICSSANQLEEMKQHIDRARKLSPDDPVVACNALDMYLELGDMPGFERVRQEIHQGRYPLDQVGVPFSTVELALDHYRDGFRLMELRYKSSEADLFMNRALFGHPRWQGEPHSGKTLLVSAEQGLGDTIQMARYLPDLAQVWNGRIVFEAPMELQELLQFNYPGVEVVPQQFGVLPTPVFDYWLGMMSLPHLLGTTSKSVPARAGYLNAPPESSDYWTRRVAKLARGRRPKIGLAWSGRPTHRADRRRSIPFIRIAEIIRKISADFFALQIHVPQARPENLIDVSEELVTLADTAALIAEMDLVITVDTSVVHLAGAMGKETWLLLPYRYEWRWGLEGESNHWYDSVKVLRQRKHDDWHGLLDETFGRRLSARLGKQREK